jgi:two-component system cell cycle response regulator DivK
MDSTRILYIEDNVGNRLLVRRVLEAEGYSVMEAVDGPSGLRVAAEEQPDLILLDINLPEIDGYDLARRLRDIPALRGAHPGRYRQRDEGGSRTFIGGRL